MGCLMETQLEGLGSFWCCLSAHVKFFCGFGFSVFLLGKYFVFNSGAYSGNQIFFPAFLKWILGHLVHLTSFSFTAETVMLELISLLLTLADFFKKFFTVSYCLAKISANDIPLMVQEPCPLCANKHAIPTPWVSEQWSLSDHFESKYSQTQQRHF